jgi:Zn-dependent protease
MTPQQYQQYMPLLVLIPVVAIIVFRNLKPRRLRLEMLWIRPVIIMVMACAFLVLTPFPHQGYAIPALIGAAIVGAGLGYARGRMVKVIVDPETHTALSQSSPLGVLFILVIIGVRFFARSSAAAGPMTPSTILATDALLLLGAGMIGVAGLEVWIRARKMVSDSRAAKAGTVTA